jgi:hypothetical protein
MEINLQLGVERMLGVDRVEVESAFLTGHGAGEGNSGAAVILVIDRT